MKKKSRIWLLIYWICLYILLVIFFSNLNKKTEKWENIPLFTQLYSNIVQVLEWKKNSVYIVAWWDIMLSRNIWYFAKNEWYDRVFKTWNYNPVSSFENCIWEDCLLIFNLESLFNEKDNDIQKWWFDFRANTWNIQTLLQLRQDHKLMLGLANNHTINTTYSWVITTKNILNEYNILNAWVWTTTWESRNFAIYEKNGIKMCIGSYSYDWQYVKVWAWKISRNKTDEKIIKEDLVRMWESACDVKILMLHRWSEYRITPNNSQKKLAHNLIDSWADLILWWHSHVPWEYEIYNGKYIFYSFWNFIFDQWRWKWSDLSYDRIFDYSLNKRTIPTYISMAIWLNIEKMKTWINITLDKISFASLTDWISSPVDEQTYSWLIERITK